MKITVLDAKTLGEDLSLEPLKELGECVIYNETKPEEIAERINDTDVVIINKIKLNETNLRYAKNLKLICLAATGYDNVDTVYCREHGIAVCNVVGYSSHSVAQLTATLVLALSTNLTSYTEFVEKGKYKESGVANRLTPVYHELFGKTWGIIGYGNIGKEVGGIAKALGCNVIYTRKTPDENTVDIDILCKEADIITIHTPLNAETKHLINEKRISLMKNDVIIVNVARGLVTDEEAVANAIKEGRVGGFATDVYSVEPFGENHPFNDILNHPNVLLTPHMAWGAYEARKRCLDEIIENIKAFYNGDIRCRVDLLE
ncbi:MAG: hydroxyacid dehydrogenase [Clostridia bacterium]|nr:hydroxyacid dehydrogenase [Clostridia bacterium]